MNLQNRLAWLYASFVSGMLLLFGAMVYALVSLLLIQQVDRTLRRTAQELIAGIRVNAVGQVEVLSLPHLDFTANVFVQVWSPDGRLQEQSPNLGDFAAPLDPLGLRRGTPILRHVRLGKAHLRVLTVPLEVSGRPVATLQLAALVNEVEQAQRTLLLALGVALALAVGLALLSGRWALRRELASLEEATRIAQLITATGDVSRRIPLPPRHQKDEIGALILAFNETLARLEHQLEVQRRFLADVGHELRTPLTIIKGNAQLMRRLQAADPEALQSIEQEADRLTRLVEELILLVQAETGRLTLQQRPVALDELALEAVQQIQVLAASKPHLKVLLEPLEPVQVCGDRDRLKQVLLNLISNAVKYTPDGGEVRLGLWTQGEQAVLQVSDTGPGIPPEDLPYIFERFYRADRARSRGQGFGLGLSIARWIVQHHGGEIRVASTVGRGTTFTVLLPRLTPETPCPPPASGQA